MIPILFPPVWMSCYLAGLVSGLLRSPLLTHHVGTLRLNPDAGKRSNVTQMRGAACCKPSCQ